MPLELQDAINLIKPYIPNGIDAAQRINEICERYLNHCDPSGSLERVTFTVTTDANGEGFITLPSRYQSIRGAVEQATSTSRSGLPLKIRNGWYEYAPGNLGMLVSTSPMRGIIPIPKSAPTDSVIYKVPVNASVGGNLYFTCICKLAFTMLENDADVLPIQNIGALKLGAKALQKEDAEDYVRAGQLWQAGETLLQKQKDNETGAEAYGKVQFDDDFALADLGDFYGCYEGGWWYG